MNIETAYHFEPESIICPGCNIVVPADAIPDIPTDLCKFCIAGYERRNQNG